VLGLPKATQINKQLPKKEIYALFKVESDDRKLFDEQISRLSIVAEISPRTTSIPQGESVSAIYVVSVSLKTPDCDKKNLILLSKLIDQRMVFVLEYEDRARLAVFRAGKLFQTEPKPTGELNIKLSGLDLGGVWERIIAQIGEIEVSEDRTLDEQIAADDERAKLLKKIERLERQARNEKQPRRKLELAGEVKRLRKELETNYMKSSPF